MANAYLDGTYTETYPDITQDAEGLRRLFRQFSFPGGIPSHVAPETPGSIHEGGELGLRALACLRRGLRQPRPAGRGGGRRRRGRDRGAGDELALQQVHQPGQRRRGAADPASQRLQDRQSDCAGAYSGRRAAQPDDRLRPQPVLLRGARRRATATIADAHRRFADLLDAVLNEIAEIKARPRRRDGAATPRWPMIVFRTPKGWTGPAYIDGKKTTGSWRAHQVPLANARDTPEHLQVLADWLASYRADELFDEDGRLDPKIAALAPTGDAADERQPAHQRRPAAEGSAAARLPRLRRRRPAPGASIAEAHPGARRSG